MAKPRGKPGTALLCTIDVEEESAKADGSAWNGGLQTSTAGVENFVRSSTRPM